MTSKTDDQANPFWQTVYLAFTKVQTLSGLLSWSYYVELLSIDDTLERGFYEKQAITEKWSVKELQREKRTALFLRISLAKAEAGASPGKLGSGCKS
jgi:DUF1016 N-terminal domain